MARGGDGPGPHRTFRDLRPRDLPRIPYWVRTQDRRRRIADTLAARGALSTEDRTWHTKADKVGITQVFKPDALPTTRVATFVVCCSCCIYGTVGAWMPLYLSTEKRWSTAEYSTFYVFWGPSTTLTAEVCPTRIRGAANGVVWFIGFFVGFVPWPFATVALQQATGSFALAFLTIPGFMVAMASGVWFIVPEHAGKELNAIAV